MRPSAKATAIAAAITATAIGGTVAALAAAQHPVTPQPAAQQPAAQGQPSAQAAVQQPGGQQRSWEPNDIFRIQWATEPQIRRDGSALAYVRNANDIMTDHLIQTLWMVDLSSGTEKQIGTERGMISSPRWSPDGKQLAYVVSTAEGKNPQLAIYSTQTSKVTASTKMSQSPRDLAWSPDGSSIAFLMLVPEPNLTLGAPLAKPNGASWADPLVVIKDVNFRIDGQGYTKRGFLHVFAMPAAGGTPRQITSGPYSEIGPLTWTTDGRGLVLASNRAKGWERQPASPGQSSPIDTQIFRVNVSDGSFTELTRRAAPNLAPTVSPDGSHIAYLGFEDKRRPAQNLHIYVMNADGRDAHAIGATLDQSVSACSWAADGRSLFFSYTDRGITKVAQMDLAGHLKPVAEGLADGTFIDLPYAGGQFSLAYNNAVAYTGAGSSRPPEVFVVHESKTAKVTHLNDQLFSQVKLATLRELTVSSSFDKRPISTWELLPASFDATKKYPLILEIHGGPFDAYGPVFAIDDQMFASAGYIVVFANPRGSTSYGEQFANLIQNDYPSHDYDDLMSAVDAAIAHGNIDPDNLFVTGKSGGGVLTAWIVGTTKRFRAAATQAPVINWTSWMLTSDMYSYAARYWFDKFPWEAQETYWKHSPLSRVGNVVTPTLVMVGDQDLRTTVAEAEQFFQALQLRNIPTELVRAPGASHVVARPSQTAAEMNAILGWFGQFRHPSAKAN